MSIIKNAFFSHLYTQHTLGRWEYRV